MDWILILIDNGYTVRFQKANLPFKASIIVRDEIHDNYVMLDLTSVGLKSITLKHINHEWQKHHGDSLRGAE